MDIAQEARDRVAVLLPILLAAIAADRGCSEDDLSLGLSRACEGALLDAVKAGYDFAHEESTVQVPLLPQVK